MAETGSSISILIVPEGSRSTRTFRLSPRKQRLLAVTSVLAGVLFAVMAGSWWFLAAKAARVDQLEVQVAELTAANRRVEALGSQLEQLESRYADLTALFGVVGDTTSAPVWIPPPRPTGDARAPTPEDGPPTSWPLTQRGFVTQPLLEGETGEHPGLDIAVPTGSYIRAAGTGSVVEVGEDPIYGRFVVIDHPDGFRSRYAHASELLVASGDSVRRNEVIALSGSTGRSTAPHLHFEILQNGELLDPLTIVKQP